MLRSTPPCSFLAVTALLSISPLFAQPAHVINQPMLHLNTTDLDASLAFYRDVIGMEEFNHSDFRDGANLGGAPGAKLRTAQLRVPEGHFQLELIEWTGADLHPQHLHIQDPGQIMLSIDVKDFAAKVAGVKKLGIKISSKGGETEMDGNEPQLMVYDPTGFLVEINDAEHQKKPMANPWPGAITGVRFYITVADLAQTAAFYKNVFGFEMPPVPPQGAAPYHFKYQFDEPAFTTARLIRNVTFPGQNFPITFQEFGGVARHAVHHGVMDPGGPIIPLTVTDFGAAIAAAKANGGIIGIGATSETLPPDARSSWVRDPNGVLLRLSAPAPARGTK
jgi:catechol 2,3-dioxygenase-like lactoylglutathione lyase family enzyme